MVELTEQLQRFVPGGQFQPPSGLPSFPNTSTQTSTIQPSAPIPPEIPISPSPAFGTPVVPFSPESLSKFIQASQAPPAPRQTAAETQRITLSRSGIPVLEIAPGTPSPKVNLGGIDPEYLAFQVKGQGPLSTDQLQQEIDALYQTGGVISQNDYRLTGGVPSGFNPQTGKPWNIGRLAGASNDSIGYWERIPDPRKRQLSDAEWVTVAQRMTPAERLRAFSETGELELPQSQINAINESQARSNALFVAGKRDRFGAVLGGILGLASTTLGATGLLFPGAGFAALGAQAGAPTTLAGAARALPGALRQFGGGQVLGESLATTFQPSTILPPELSEFVSPATTAAGVTFPSELAEFAAPATAAAGTVGGAAPGVSNVGFFDALGNFVSGAGQVVSGVSGLVGAGQAFAGAGDVPTIAGAAGLDPAIHSITTPSFGATFGTDPTLTRVGGVEPRAIEEAQRQRLGVLGGQFAGLREQIPGLQGQLAAQPFGDIRAGTANLRERVDATRAELGSQFGKVREARLQAAGDVRDRTIGNLRDTLRQRRILGSSFASADIERAELGFGQEEQRIISEAAIQEAAIAGDFDRISGQLLQLDQQTLLQETQNIAIQAGLNQQEAQLLGQQVVTIQQQMASIAQTTMRELQELGIVGNISNDLGAVIANVGQSNMTAALDNATARGELIGGIPELGEQVVSGLESLADVFGG